MMINSEMKAKIDNGLQSEFGYNLTLIKGRMLGAHGSTQPNGYNYMSKNNGCNSNGIKVSNAARAEEKEIRNGQQLCWTHSPYKTFIHELVHAYQLESYDYEDWFNYASGKKHRQCYVVNELVANTVAALILEDFYNDMTGHNDNASYLAYYTPQLQYKLDYKLMEDKINKYYNSIKTFITNYDLTNL